MLLAAGKIFHIEENSKNIQSAYQQGGSMPGLQEAFYIIAIVFMAVMFVLLIALVSAVFVIRSKVNHIQRQIEDRINMVTGIAEKGGEVAAAVVGGVARKAKRAIAKR